MSDWRVLIDGDTRPPVAWMTYPKPPDPDPARPLGPTYNGEWLWPVAVDGCRLGFSYQAPPGADRAS